MLGEKHCAVLPNGYLYIYIYNIYKIYIIATPTFTLQTSPSARSPPLFPRLHGTSWKTDLSRGATGVEKNAPAGLREPPNGHALHVCDGAVPRAGGQGLPRAGLEGIHHSATVQRYCPLGQVFLSGECRNSRNRQDNRERDTGINRAERTE